MGHILMDLELEDTKGKKKLEKVLVDTGATFTCVEEEVLEEIGTQKLPAKVEVEPGNGDRVTADSVRSLNARAESERTDGPLPAGQGKHLAQARIREDR